MQHQTLTDLTQRQLSVRLARDEADLAAVQRLRWRVFCEEMGASVESAADGRDRDRYDPLCDHLMVIAEDGAGQREVVGTYRLLRQSVARQNWGFYSAGEYDLTPLQRASVDCGELLELGRSCVLPAYRTSATIALLWRGISEYIAQHGIGLMFGCASFPGRDPERHRLALIWLHRNHLAAADQRPRVLPGENAWFPDGDLPTDFDPRRTALDLPPLVKAYLRVGATIGEGAYVDRAFNTVDVCVVMPVERISARYAARFSAAA